jgi:hypothetical protein
MIGWILVGLATLIAGAVMAKPEIVERFWKSIEGWLNTTAADAVERMFGYQARQRMYRTVSKVNYVIERHVAKNRSTVYSKKSRLDDTIVMTVLETEAPEAKLDRGLLEDIKANRCHVAEYQYKI